MVCIPVSRSDTTLSNFFKFQILKRTQIKPFCLFIYICIYCNNRLKYGNKPAAPSLLYPCLEAKVLPVDISKTKS